jgi:predicted nucleotidyltransferase
MRIKEEEKLQIKKITKIYFGDDAKVYLFGSRVNDKKLGGDIDLYIETGIKENIVQRKIKMVGKLHEILGEQKIDIVINAFGSDKPIYQAAKNEGIAL